MPLIDPAKLALIAMLAWGGPAMAQTPLSSSDWLSGRRPAPAPISAWRPGDPVPHDARKRQFDNMPPKPRPDQVASSAGPVPIGVTRLDGQNPDQAGIISARQAGLTRDFWQETDFDHAITLVAGARPVLPASQSLLRRILEAQLPPPSGITAAQTGDFLLARVDRLMDQGAISTARALLEAAGPKDRKRFQRLFDIALILADESKACRIMDKAPGIAPGLGERIFCLAQTGDWTGAALSFHGAKRLDMLEPSLVALLEQYLDDSYIDQDQELSAPDIVTPLDFRLMEAIGQPLPTTGLPLALAWSDLRDSAGWKAQLEAGERLARAGTVTPRSLRKLYLSQKPAASGGVWERAAGMHALDSALTTDDPDRIGAALKTAFARMEEGNLRDSFANAIAADLPQTGLADDTARLALWLRLWAGEQGMAVTDQDRDLVALATGGKVAVTSGDLGLIAAALDGEIGTRPAYATDVFTAMADVDAGVAGDLSRAARGIAHLREMGLISDARRMAVQLILGPIMDTGI